MENLIWIICTIFVYGFEAIVIAGTFVAIYCMANKISGRRFIDWLIR